MTREELVKRIDANMYTGEEVAILLDRQGFKFDPSPPAPPAPKPMRGEEIAGEMVSYNQTNSTIRICSASAPLEFVLFDTKYAVSTADEIKGLIARAIDDAIAEEREACAKVAKGAAEHGDTIPDAYARGYAQGRLTATENIICRTKK